MIDLNDYPRINQLTNRHIARCLKNIEPIDECRKKEIKALFRWLATDIIETMNGIERNEENDYQRNNESSTNQSNNLQK